MKQIKLTQGKFTLVDDEDFDKLNLFKWYADGKNNLWYARGGCVLGKTIFMHRVIMNVTDRNIFIDHKDGNGLNNQKSNLRYCTHAENMRNRKPNKNGVSKYLGVSWCSFTKKWRAVITHKRQWHLGRFENETEAAKAYNEKAKELFKEFARLNAV